jgi:ubiquinone/menaquinone biosynthesis C-methylase UbiE
LSAQISNLRRSVDYVCPDCKGQLLQLMCTACRTQFYELNSIPNLLPKAPRYESAARISRTYDEIYSHHTNVWEDQGRPKEFIAFFSDLVAGLSTGRILEVGCGEGILLDAMKSDLKVAIDISSLALQKTQQRTHAQCAVAIAERLPYASESFDIVISVGVMEHFLDENEATTEIRRVLKSGGCYIALIHTTLNVTQRLQQKIREYIFPRLRPVALIRWVLKKLYHPISQPLQTHYTSLTGRACLERNGLAIERVITSRDRPQPPLAGQHVVIYVTRKPYISGYRAS